MSSYTVRSRFVSGFKPGATVTADDFPPGTNVPALVASGHLVPTEPKKSNKGPKE